MKKNVIILTVIVLIAISTYFILDINKKEIMKEGNPINKKETFISFAQKDSISYRSRIHNDSFEIYQNDKWQPLTIKGVNIGMGKPGHFPGEAAISEEEYYRWFEAIGEMNANAIRVYTLHPPGFYNALKQYNESHENQLYLFHGVWIDEEPLEDSLDAYTPEIADKFQGEFKKIVDVIHGNKIVEQEPGHAYGNYEANVSPYVIGWIIGIEWYPYMVDNMSKKYKGQPDFEGTYLSTHNGNGMEQWLAWQLNELANYEVSKYQTIRPMSFTNWVSTDLLDHPAEPSEQEDLASVNPNNMIANDIAREVGMFASYHVYPYYPDFLNLEEKYTTYKDHRGNPNNYAGYLNDLNKAHEMPILIAEYGIPASRGMTHVNPFGWNQGFIEEKEQGEYLVHFFEDMMEENLLGGLIFTWQDEWFKRTWNTMDYDNPDRRPYWSNAQTNEQQFGLLSFDRQKIKLDGNAEDWKDSVPIYRNKSQMLKQVYVDHDERYLYIRLDFDKEKGNWYDNSSAAILFDVNPNQGNQRIESIPNIEFSSSGADFLLNIPGKDDGELLVSSYYDPFLYQYSTQLNMIHPLPEHPSDNDGTFNPIRYVLNKEMIRPDTKEVFPFQFYETGKLKHGIGNPASEEYDSLADYYMNDETSIMEIRIPWLLLNVKDPSQKEIIGDLYNNGLEESKFIDGISITTILLDKQNNVIESFPKVDNKTQYINNPYVYEWENWDLPTYEERLKKSYDIVQSYFRKIE